MPKGKGYGSTNKKKSHGYSNPREDGRTGRKVGNGPHKQTVTSRHGTRRTIKRRSHRGL